MKKKKVELPSLRAPKGYYFKVQKNNQYSIYVRLFEKKKNRMAGHIELVLMYPYNKSKRLATHSWLRVDLRHQGLGTLIYSKAIEWGLKNGYRVRSSGGSSEMAQRVWNGKGIRRHFNIRKRDNDIWYAYAKKAIKKDRAKNKRR